MNGVGTTIGLTLTTPPNASGQAPVYNASTKQWNPQAIYTKAQVDALLAGIPEPDLTSYVKTDGTRAFTGPVSGITAGTSDNSTKLATTAFVKSAIQVGQPDLTPYAPLAGATFTGPVAVKRASGVTGSLNPVLSLLRDDGQSLLSFYQSGIEPTIAAQPGLGFNISASLIRLPTTQAAAFVGLSGGVPKLYNESNGVVLLGSDTVPSGVTGDVVASAKPFYATVGIDVAGLVKAKGTDTGTGFDVQSGGNGPGFDNANLYYDGYVDRVVLQSWAGKSLGINPAGNTVSVGGPLNATAGATVIVRDDQPIGGFKVQSANGTRAVSIGWTGIDQPLAPLQIQPSGAPTTFGGDATVVGTLRASAFSAPNANVHIDSTGVKIGAGRSLDFSTSGFAYEAADARIFRQGPNTLAIDNAAGGYASVNVNGRVTATDGFGFGPTGIWFSPADRDFRLYDIVTNSVPFRVNQGQTEINGGATVTGVVTLPSTAGTFFAGARSDQLGLALDLTASPTYPRFFADPYGRLYLNPQVLAGLDSSQLDATLIVGGRPSVPVSIFRRKSDSLDFVQWQESTGAVLAKVTSDGGATFNGPLVATAGATVTGNVRSAGNDAGLTFDSRTGGGTGSWYSPGSRDFRLFENYSSGSNDLLRVYQGQLLVAAPGGSLPAPESTPTSAAIFGGDVKVIRGKSLSSSYGTGTQVDLAGLYTDNVSYFGPYIDRNSGMGGETTYLRYGRGGSEGDTASRDAFRLDGANRIATLPLRTKIAATVASLPYDDGTSALQVGGDAKVDGSSYISGVDVAALQYSRRTSSGGAAGLVLDTNGLQDWYVGMKNGGTALTMFANGVPNDLFSLEKTGALTVSGSLTYNLATLAPTLTIGQAQAWRDESINAMKISWVEGDGTLRVATLNHD